MTEALVIAYYFPPIGGAGSQRWLKLARYLPDGSAGVRVRILTGPGASGSRWSPRDESLETELPPEVAVHRVPSAEPAAASRWGGRAERWLGIASPWAQWWIDGAIAAGMSAGVDADVLIASMSPYASAVAATALSRRLDKPWIADLRDPWALDEMTLYPTVLHRRLELRRMRRALAAAAAVVTTTPEAARRIALAFPELRAVPVVSVPNGYDGADFVAAPPERSDEAFRIVHAGYLHTALGQEQRAGRLRRLLRGDQEADILTRSHVFLLEALDRLKAARPDAAARIELHLAGVLSDRDREVAARYDFVRLHGYVEHRAAVELMRSADLLFLPMHKMRSGRRSSIVPGKTYEYVASGRPILAAVPEGDAREILLDAGAAQVCEPDDVAGMAAAVARELDRRESNHRSPAPPTHVLERFERRTLAREYADLIERVAAAGCADRTA